MRKVTFSVAGSLDNYIARRNGKIDCILGGAEAASMLTTLFEVGLIDEVGINIHPVLLGSGVPLFHEMSRQVDLALIECKTFKNDCVSVTYRVKSRGV